MSVMLEFAMFPTDKGEGVSKYVSRIIKVIDESGVNYQLTPMGTVIETETMGQALDIVRQAYETLQVDCNRVYSSLKFDIRSGNLGRMEQKVKSIESVVGEVKK